MLNKRETKILNDLPIPIFSGDRLQAKYSLISPIITEGDLIGGIVCTRLDRAFGERERDLLKVTTEILASEFTL